MSILQDAEEPTSVSSPSIESDSDSDDESLEAAEQSSVAAKPEEKKFVKALRTGTFPYISCNVLRGKRHTHFGDVESFLYVLFFFSYAGPLPKKDIEDAHEKGFVRAVGCGRLSHTRSWPEQLAKWADGDPLEIVKSKSYYIFYSEGAMDLIDSAEVKDCLQNNWPEALRHPIRSLLRTAFVAFRKSVKGGRTELSHAQFISKLDEWLVKYSELEHKYSNCPDFKDPRLVDISLASHVSC
ncbi:hypothetical protein OG21DRAFT_1491683 [Imleria badia]|nr:hypothetical protein OG21DRAFT_1491683 [Imleria badia]